MLVWNSIVLIHHNGICTEVQFALRKQELSLKMQISRVLRLLLCCLGLH